ncbi:DoxX family membrane protein [Haladaptatus sp.]|uniref:DoxX family membrane protein n=1 Tax=Haladaptatus sp. TaxID=1973141 RepID=UPI003C6197FD
MVENVNTSLLGREVSFDFSGPWSSYVIVLTRLLVGWWFTAAGLEKFANLWYGPAESFDASGWLVHGTTAAPGWLHGFLVWAGNTGWLLAFANVMIPLGELLIGLGVLFGVLTRLASFFGAFLLFFFYLGGADFANGYVTGELLGILLFMQLIVFGAGRIWGLDAIIEGTDFVNDHTWMRYLLG